MATYALTPANVIGSNVNIEVGVAGAAIAQGVLLYQKASDGRLYAADNNVTVAEAACIGIALSSASAAGQPLYFTRGGEITTQAALFAGQGKPLFMSSAAGVMCDPGDVLTGQWLTHIGHTTATNKFMLRPYATGLTSV